jgi:hypothetical protein
MAVNIYLCGVFVFDFLWEDRIFFLFEVLRPETGMVPEARGQYLSCRYAAARASAASAGSRIPTRARTGLEPRA